MKPDLSNPEALAAYRAELRGLARGWRLLGFVLIVAGVGLQFYLRTRDIDSGPLWPASWTLIAAGWAVFAGVIGYRTGYHRARMAED